MNQAIGNSQLKPVVCLMGPTACGKTDIGLSLADHINIEIISVDSAMVYRGMNIGTAKPCPEILRQIPHHLIDIINPDESYSVALFCQNTNECIKAIYERGNIPILIGGTMMYYHALQNGLASLPEACDDHRLAIVEQARKKGWAYLHQQLKSIDPVSAQHIHEHDAKRIQRALEVFQISGRPLSSFKNNPQNQNYQFENIIIMPSDRAHLHERINKRFVAMVEMGLVDEVKALIHQWQLTVNHPSLKSIGYRQAFEYLTQSHSYQSFIEKGQAATRQLAKRQMTWLRSWKQDATYFDIDDEESIINTVKSIVK